jgi:HK97 gp10 family phage protein
MATSSVRIEGLAELERALLQLPAKLTRQVLERSLLAGGRVVVAEAKRRAPLLTGELRRNIRAIRNRRDRRYSATIDVGVRKLSKKQIRKLRTRKGRANASDPFYWRFQEFGTSKMRARPFLRPAFEAKKVDAAFRIKDEIRARLDKIAGRAR